jgi:hypothetical protein
VTPPRPPVQPADEHGGVDTPERPALDPPAGGVDERVERGRERPLGLPGGPRASSWGEARMTSDRRDRTVRTGRWRKGTLGMSSPEQSSVGETRSIETIRSGATTADTAPFDNRYELPPFVVNIRTTGDWRPIGLRYQNLAPNSGETFVNEERSMYHETAHDSELVGYLCLDASRIPIPPVKPTYPHWRPDLWTTLCSRLLETLLPSSRLSIAS